MAAMIRSMCPDCGVRIGEAHQPTCPLAGCVTTRRYRRDCTPDHHCPPTVWTGRVSCDRAAASLEVTA